MNSICTFTSTYTAAIFLGGARKGGLGPWLAGIAVEIAEIPLKIFWIFGKLTPAPS